MADGISGVASDALKETGKQMGSVTKSQLSSLVQTALPDLVKPKVPEHTPEEKEKIANLKEKLKSEATQAQSKNFQQYTRTFTAAHFESPKSTTQVRNEQFEREAQQNQAFQQQEKQ